MKKTLIAICRKEIDIPNNLSKKSKDNLLAAELQEILVSKITFKDNYSPTQRSYKWLKIKPEVVKEFLKDL